jgi:NAD(P)-dependent dehydrogenase (short-subunit alcohol dehydrogenase family)
MDRRTSRRSDRAVTTTMLDLQGSYATGGENDMDWGLTGKTALVTGAAAGIGAGIARHFSDAGARVFGADLAWPEGERTETPSLTPVALDVTDREAVRSAVQRIAEEANGLHVLVNNAGTMRARDSFFEYDGNDWESMLTVNASGLFFCVQAAAEVMSERGEGAIINVASIAGRNGRTLSPPYAASKAAVINITRSAALALASKGIRVNAVAPGIIDTGFNRRLGAQFGPREGLTPEEYVAKRAEIVPLGRVGTPDDVARVVCFLASPHSGYVTGQTLNVDGGIVMD